MKLTEVAEGHPSSLWPTATTFDRSQRGYSRSYTATGLLHCPISDLDFFLNLEILKKEVVIFPTNNI